MIWELLETALADLRAVEKDERYVVDMNHWHMPTKDGCAVCLAGAWLAGKGLQPDEVWHPYTADGDERRKALTLDCLRTGALRAACLTYYDYVPTHLDPWHAPDKSLEWILQRLKDLDL